MCADLRLLLETVEDQIETNPERAHVLVRSIAHVLVAMVGKVGIQIADALHQLDSGHARAKTVVTVVDV